MDHGSNTSIIVTLKGLHGLKKCFLAFSLGLMLSGLSQFAYTLPAKAVGRLTASIEHQRTMALPQRPMARLIDHSNGEVLENATIKVPALGYQTKTNQQGEFQLPPMPEKATIVSFEKQGYLPSSVSWGLGRLDTDANNRHTFRLQSTRRGVVLDNGRYHLGDNSFSQYSAAAAHFKATGAGIALKKKFILEGDLADANEFTLRIGSIIGLDTLAAQRLGQSHFHKFSSPLTVVFNGHAIGQIAINGDNQRITLPRHLAHLNGVNTLELHTGFHRPDGVRVDYDDIELMHLTLEF